MQVVIDALLVGGPLDGSTVRVCTPYPETLDFMEHGELVTYAYAGFKDQGFDAELVVYCAARVESIAA